MKGASEPGKYGFDLVNGMGWKAQVGRGYYPLDVAEPGNAAALVPGDPVTAAGGAGPRGVPWVVKVGVCALTQDRMPIFQAAPTALENTSVLFLQMDRAYGAGMSISQVVICESFISYVSAILV
jgi:hypothetical protein